MSTVVDSLSSQQVTLDVKDEAASNESMSAGHTMNGAGTLVNGAGLIKDGAGEVGMKNGARKGEEVVQDEPKPKMRKCEKR